MQEQDQSEKIDVPEEDDMLSEPVSEESVAASRDDVEKEPLSESSSYTSAEASSGIQPWRFDWPALIVALAIAALFALTARFNSQPSPSYVPAAIFSATGCGLLVTAIHKLRRRAGAGLLEAGLSGLGMALLQFLVTFTYPGVWTTITSIPDYSRAFLLTWGLIALFAVVLSLAGATIGHLAFAPLRPLPTHTRKPLAKNEDEEDEDTDLEQDEASTPSTSTASAENAPSALLSKAEAPDDEAGEDEEQTDEDEAEETGEDETEEHLSRVATVAQPQRPLLSYVITVLLLGLLPMMVGYVFAACYDFLMNAINVNSISPALYPTLSLLSGLLPWRLPAPIALGGQNGMFIIFTLLWRIPDSTLGNPNLFDVQALESLVFNAAGLALLLITLYNCNNTDQRRSAPWGVFLFLESLFGLILILPANLWLLRGLEGVLQMGGIVVALPTLQLLNPVLFTLNVVTGALFCPIIGLIVRRQYQLWTAPRVNVPEKSGPVA